MSLVVDILLSSTLRDSLFFRKMLANYIIEDIIYARVISNNSSSLLYNTIVLKYRKESSLLIIPTIA